MTPLGAFALFTIGVGASIFGSVVGLGGGFIIIPVLRIFYGVAPAEVAGTSLVLVLANTASATVGYLRHRVVDLRLAVPFAIAALPGSIVGVLVVRRSSPGWFDAAYGAVLLINAALVLRRRTAVARAADERSFAHHPAIAIGAGFAIGFFSSLFGIGGGIVLIPLLLVAARMEAHIVTATSAFVITVTAPVGVAAHAWTGDIDWGLTLPLLLGGLVGGSLGPPIARRIASPTLIALLASALILSAAGLALRHVF